MKKYLILAVVIVGAFVLLRQAENRTPFGKITGAKA